ncbi:hypothetical protein GO013_01005 [Pseudodesulfovibrio sp. JC047]|nr:hypothetical protein [Pseudodesulfovibrio sp. JC047]NDV17994.1 hypothetical protein [Pseudodesulfovibrio sp. JC047]
MERLAIFVDAGYFWVQTTMILHGEKVPRNQVILDYDMLHKELLATAKK